MTDATPPRRVGDDDAEDFRERRAGITGDEVRVGAGKYAVTLRGGMVIQVVCMMALLGVLGYHTQEQTKVANSLAAQIAKDHRDMSHAINYTLRLQTCVTSMTADERIQWRSSRDAQAALFTYCPGLLMPAVPIQ